MSRNARAALFAWVALAVVVAGAAFVRGGRGGAAGWAADPIPPASRGDRAARAKRAVPPHPQERCDGSGDGVGHPAGGPPGAGARRHARARGEEDDDARAPAGAGGLRAEAAPRGSATPSTADDRLSALLGGLRRARGRGDFELAQHLEQRLAGELGGDPALRAAWTRRARELRDAGEAGWWFDLGFRALGGSSDGAVAWSRALRELLDSGAPARVRAEAIAAWRPGIDAEEDSAWRVRLLRAVSGESDPEVRIRALRVLAVQGGGAEAAESIAALARGHADPAVRAAAVGAWDGRSAVFRDPALPLDVLAEDPSPLVRRSAGEALERALLRPGAEDTGRGFAGIGTAEAAGLSERLEVESDAAIRSLLLRVLVLAEGVAALSELMAHGERETDPGLLRGMNAALGLIEAGEGAPRTLHAALCAEAPESALRKE